jgi:carotenoid cleavage dioxygenase
MSNRFLEGNFAPVHEELTTTELSVTGSIPDHLDGRYLRIGPNPVGTPDPATHHWFVGSGMVHGVRIRDGQAEWYRNRWVRSADVAETLGEEPHPGPVHAGMDVSPNTGVIGHAGRTFALVEAGFRPYELTDELETVGPCDFDGSLPGGFTAHPKRDPGTGELHAMAYFFGWGNRVQYVVVGVDGKVRRTVGIDVHGSPMMHDFSLTEDHVVVYDLPVAFDLDMAAGGAALPYRWDRDYPARVGVMARDGDGSDVAWFDIEPCYVFHPMNAYQEGFQIVLDVVRHPKMFDTDLLGPNEGPPSLDRWTVDLAAGKVTEERLDDRAQEFPRVDERLTGRRHRYGYCIGSAAADQDPFDASAVIKHDLAERSSQVRDLGREKVPNELVFVPHVGSGTEDDGVLMGYVYDSVTDRSELRLLDAATLEDVATVHLPARIPHGFHGNWVAAT